MASFISIGCSAFTTKCPVRYCSIARTLLISSSLKPYAERAVARSPNASTVRERRNNTLAAAADTAMRLATTGQVTALVGGAGTAGTAMTGRGEIERQRGRYWRRH